MNIKDTGQTIIRLPQKLKEYAQHGTEEDLESSSATGAVLGGAVEGLITGGPIIAAAGGIGGYAGVKVGEEGSIIPTIGRAIDGTINATVNIAKVLKYIPTWDIGKQAPPASNIVFARKFTDKFISQGTFLKAITAGAITGAALSAVAVTGISVLGGAPLILENLLAGGILGGLAGTAGTLSGSRRASTRDGVYGGYLTGLMAGAFMHNPAMMIAGAVSGGIGGKAVKPLGRAILGTLAGTFTGALTGVFGGPTAIAVGAITGALVGGIGATIGPPMRQVIRNVTDDIANAAFNKINPVIKGKIGTKGKIALGAIAGALSLAPLGLIFGPLVGGILTGLGIAGGIGAITGGISTFLTLRQSEGGLTVTEEEVRKAADDTHRYKEDTDKIHESVHSWHSTPS